MVPNGYIGLCRLSRDRVNVCGLFRRRTAVHDRNLAPIEHFTTAPSLRERLRHAEWHEDSLVAVSALPLREQIRHGDALSVGDAFSMIPPFTGNGMSVAIESGFVAAESLVRYARKECSWPDAIRQFQSAGGKLFKRRFTLANFAQGLLNNALCQQLFVRTADHSWLWRRVFELTR